MKLIHRISRKLNSILIRIISKLQSGKFQLPDLSTIPDIELAVGVLGTESFRRKLKPIALNFHNIRSMLVVAPHQDDETIGAGGTLTLAAKAGVKVHVLFATDGGQDNMPPYSVQDIVRIRYREAEEVCSRIGAGIHKLEISNDLIQPTLEHVDRLSEIIREVNPQVILLPWILDWPAKHRLVNHLLYLAYKRKGMPSFKTWGYQVHNTLYPNAYIDITSVAEEKRRLLSCYHSQNDHYRDYVHEAMGMAAWNERFLPVAYDHPVSRFAEVFYVLPSEELFRLIEHFYLPDLTATYGGDERVIPGMTEIHNTVMGKENADFIR